MNIRALCVVVIMSGLMAAVAPSQPSSAQSNDTGVAAPGNAGASAASSMAQTTTMTPNKHRYWRHRGGKHPHYGSRRVRT